MSLVYLYAVGPAEVVPWLGANEVRGIGGAPVRALAEGPVAAVVSDVPSAEFEQDPLDRNVADASWLGPRAAAHQDVNARLMDGLGAVLPLAFGTLFRGEDGVRGALRGRAGDLALALGALAGRAEWVVTLERDRDRALAAVEREPRVAGRVRAAAEATPGRAYLLRKGTDDERLALLRERDAGARTALAAALTAAGGEVTEEPIVEGGPVARLTVLGPRDEAAFGRALDPFGRDWEPRGYAAGVTGPWPPYRYAARLGAIR